MKEVSLDDILLTIAKWRVQAYSSHNDGWTSSAYRDNLKKIKEELEGSDKPKQSQERQSDAGSLFF